MTSPRKYRKKPVEVEVMAVKTESGDYIFLEGDTVFSIRVEEFEATYEPVEDELAMRPEWRTDPDENFVLGWFDGHEFNECGLYVELMTFYEGTTGHHERWVITTEVFSGTRLPKKFDTSEEAMKMAERIMSLLDEDADE